MFANLYNIIPSILNAIFDTLYICAWFYFLSRNFYYFHPLKEEIDILKSQQDILYKAIKKLKNIIDIDNNSISKKLKNRYGHIKSNLDSMCSAFEQRIDKIENILSSNEANKAVLSEEEKNKKQQDETSTFSNNISKSNNSKYITFPLVNYKLLSCQLCEVFDYKLGTYMTEKEIYEEVLSNIIYNKRNMSKFQELFGINYDINSENLLNLLKPHLK